MPDYANDKSEPSKNLHLILDQFRKIYQENLGFSMSTFEDCFRHRDRILFLCGIFSSGILGHSMATIGIVCSINLLNIPRKNATIAVAYTTLACFDGLGTRTLGLAHLTSKSIPAAQRNAIDIYEASLLTLTMMSILSPSWIFTLLIWFAQIHEVYIENQTCCSFHE